MKKSDLMTMQLVVTVCLLGVVQGLALSTVIPVGQTSGWLRVMVGIIAVAGMAILVRRSLARLSALCRQRESMRRGATGELQVGNILKNLPDDFCVVNDLSTSFGNLDHVVVGPTGVFVLDAKNWRGVVSADGNGELLLNGRATEKSVIRQLVGRMMGIREKVRALAPGPDPYYEALMVFTSARVEAKWGATGKTTCVRDDQVHDYIVQKTGHRLTQSEVNQIAQAFAGLAHMDRSFALTVDGAQTGSGGTIKEKASNQPAVSASAFARWCKPPFWSPPRQGASGETKCANRAS